MSEKPIPCGGCGATEDRQRCIGCLHDFGTPDSSWVKNYRQEPHPEYGDQQEPNPEAEAANATRII